MVKRLVLILMVSTQLLIPQYGQAGTSDGSTSAVTIRYSIEGATKPTATATITIEWPQGASARVYIYKDNIDPSNPKPLGWSQLYEGRSPFVHNNQLVDATRRYQLEFLDDAGNVASTSYTSIYTAWLSAPKDFSAKRNADGTTLLTWAQAPEPYAKGYRISRREMQLGFVVLADIVDVSTTSYTDTTVEKGKDYVYMLHTYDGEEPRNYSGNADVSSYWIPAPGNFQAQAGDGMVTLTWDKVQDPWIAGYRIYQFYQSSGAKILINEIKGVNITSFVHAGLKNGTTYYYNLRAVDDQTPAKESEFYAYASARPGTDPTGPPKAPVWWKVISGDGAVRLLWVESPEADLVGYRIYRSESLAALPVQIGASSYGTYRDTTVTNDTFYYYWVAAYDSEGLESAFSEAKEAYPFQIDDQTDPNRVLVVYTYDYATDENKNGVSDVDEVLNHYIQRRGIPMSNIMELKWVTGVFNSWQDRYDAFVAPIQAKLNELGPENIYHILLINIYPWTDYCTTQTVMMDIYNLVRESKPIIQKKNPFFRYGNRTFREPNPRFNHASYNTLDKREFYYTAAQLNGLGALSQIEAAVYGELYGGHENYLGGYHVIDGRYGTYAEKGNIHDLLDPLSRWNLDNYPNKDPYMPFYSYTAMDLKVAACVRYLDEKGIKNYKWHPQDWVVGAVPGQNFEDGTPVGTDIPALSYGGWYEGSYKNVYNWLPGSFYSQVVSYNAPAQRALEHGCTFVSGALDEPFTHGVPQPAELVYYTLEGYTFGEAVAYSLPQVNWRNWSSGDPLTCVYRKGKEAQLDTTPPPMPASYYYLIDPNTVELYASLDTTGREPDVAYWKLEYGESRGRYTGTIDYEPLWGYWVQKRWILTGLKPDTTYYYSVHAKDPAGNETVSGERTFVTGVAAQVISIELDNTLWRVEIRLGQRARNVDQGGAVLHHITNTGNAAVTLGIRYVPGNNSAIKPGLAQGEDTFITIAGDDVIAPDAELLLPGYALPGEYVPLSLTYGAPDSLSQGAQGMSVNYEICAYAK